VNVTITGGYNPTLALLARLLFAALFLTTGIRKILIWGPQVAYFTRLGFPAPEFFTVLAIIIEIGGAILLAVGWHTRWVAWLLIVFLVIATGMAHRFWEFDAAQQANQLNHFLKNIALIGGMLYIATFGPGRASADKS
jgi:putative oxidoreductase